MYKITDIQLKNQNARFLHRKNPNKPVMVFIPGNLQEIETIENLNVSFGANFNYYAIELPGTGHTNPLHPSYNIRFLADCLSEFVTQYIKGPFHLVSCSYATALALEYAKANSHKISKLVLAGSMQEIPLSEWPTVLGLMADCMRDTRQFASDFMQLLTAPDVDIPRQKLIIRATKMKYSDYTEKKFWCFIFNSIRLMTYAANNLHLIRCPTLCFTGEHDPYVTPSRCLSLAKQIPHAKFEALPNADHLFHLEQPEQTVRLITSYLNEPDLCSKLTPQLG